MCVPFVFMSPRCAFVTIGFTHFRLTHRHAFQITCSATVQACKENNLGVLYDYINPVVGMTSLLGQFDGDHRHLERADLDRKRRLEVLFA